MTGLRKYCASASIRLFYKVGLDLDEAKIVELYRPTFISKRVI